MEHIAVMSDKQYIDNILKGLKTIESRFSKNKITPYHKIRTGETVYLKVSGSYITVKFTVDKVLFFDNLNVEKILALKEKYNDGISAPDDYWSYKKDCKYGTLIYIKNPEVIFPIKIYKKNRQAFMTVEDIFKDILMTKQNITKNVSDCSHDHHLIDLKKDKLKCLECNFKFNNEKLMKHSSYLIVKEELLKSKWNYDWFNMSLDNVAINKLNISDEDVTKRLKESVVKYNPKIDGKQTSYSGNPIYYAQHALGLCCRNCMGLWWGIPLTRELTKEEITYFTYLIKEYLKDIKYNMI